MKIIIILIASCLFGGLASSEPSAKDGKEAFVKFYRAWSKFQVDFPDHPEVRVLFFDIDSDGTNEAIATDRGQFGETGYSWNVFQFRNEIWSAVKLKKIDETTVDPSSGIFARTEEFCSLELINKPLGLIVVHKDYDRRASDGMAAPQAFSITIDNNGFVKTEKLGSLDQLIGYSEDFHKLQRLGVETFKD